MNKLQKHKNKHKRSIYDFAEIIFIAISLPINE